MNYFLDLFSPETYEAFGRSDRSVSGFRPRHKNAADRVRIGDKLVCYMTRLSRWFGVLEVVEGPFHDNTPIFFPEADPFVVRFRVRPIGWLAVEKAVPIYEDAVWNQLSFTKGQTRGTPTWAGRVRTSLVQLSAADGKLLESLLPGAEPSRPGLSTRCCGFPQACHPSSAALGQGCERYGSGRPGRRPRSGKNATRRST